MHEEYLNNPQLNPQVIFSWKAPLRPYKKRGKNVLRFYVALALLLSLIIVFFGDKILLIPIWAVLFLFYTLTITPPPQVENKITKFGIELAGVTLRWEALSHFYLTKRFGFNMATIVSHGPYYLHSYLVLPNEEIKNKVMSILSEHLVYQEKPQRNFTDKAVDWLSKLLPDDEDEKTNSQSSFSQIKEPIFPSPQTGVPNG
ncbi:MAG: hypothetical protein HYW86_00360 [Candidatus Roizmanbacteria bacterium]|nr:MAG: hypothetical protein HYW86_00360 [Candidatus Roizmanbacteria bacterium]